MGLFLKVALATVFKAEPIKFEQLRRDQWTQLRVGQQFELDSYKAWGNHLEVRLRNPIEGRSKGYVFTKHAELWKDGRRILTQAQLTDSKPTETQGQKVLLDVVFFSQVERQQEPSKLPKTVQERICNTASNAMIAVYLGAEISGDEEFLTVVERFGDTTNHHAITSALAAIGVKSIWRTDLTFDDIDRSLDAGLPVAIGILHRGSLSAPRGGHVLVVIGRTSNGDYIVNDPFGSLNDGYTSDVNNGRQAVYSRAVLVARWLVSTDPRSRTGWGRLFER